MKNCLVFLFSIWQSQDVKTITHKDLVGIIAAQSGAFTVGILSETATKARKNPFGKIMKRARLSGMVGANYQTAVNREGERQGVAADFQAEERTWGTWLIPNKVAENDEKTKFYLHTQSTPGQRKLKTARVLAYLSETGETLTREQVNPFLPVVKESKKQQSKGLKDTVYVREFAFDSILKIRVAGETFRLVKD